MVHDVGVCQCYDVVDAFVVEEVFDHRFESTVFVLHRYNIASLLKMSITTNPYLGSVFFFGILVSRSLVTRTSRTVLCRN